MTYVPPITGLPDPVVLSTMTDDAVALGCHVGQAGASSTWPTSNAAYFFPVRLSGTHTYVKAWWLNGATAAGNVDVGIYTLSGTTMTRVVASTAEAQGTVSVMQVATTFTSTTIGPGLYYLAMSLTLNTATVFRGNTQAVAFAKAAGYFTAASQSPLPTSCTVVASNSTIIPIFGFSEQAAI